MVQSDRRTYLPPSTELPDSDDIPFELYKLIDNIYQLQLDKPFWMPKINLAIGRYQGTAGGIQQELLGWFDAQDKRYLTPEEKAERLAARLRKLGEDPDQI